MLAYGVTYADAARIQATIPTVSAVTLVREYRKTLWRRDKKVETRIVGVTPEFFAQSNMPVIRGRGFEPADERQYANVCVLGATGAEILFPAEDPIGKTVGVDNLDELKAFTVVGLTAPRRWPPAPPTPATTRRCCSSRSPATGCGLAARS